jgi:hypothetical protein
MDVDPDKEALFNEVTLNTFSKSFKGPGIHAATRIKGIP